MGLGKACPVKPDPIASLSCDIPGLPTTPHPALLPPSSKVAQHEGVWTATNLCLQLVRVISVYKKIHSFLDGHFAHSNQYHHYDKPSFFVRVFPQILKTS
jgi:hypothetical protein